MRFCTAVVSALLVLALSGCADDSDEPGASTGESPTAGQTEDTGDAGELPAACDVVDAVAVEEAYGQQVPPGDQSAGGHSDSDDVQWQTDNCNFEAAGALEVSVQLSTVADFEVADQFCPELTYLGDPSEPVEGLGDQAAWIGREDPNEVEATLRVCTGETMLDIEVDSSLDGAGVEELRAQTVALAETVLANLG